MGCSRSPEALITRQIAIMDEFGEALSGITDEDSARQAAPKLAQLQSEINALIPSVKALNLTPEARDAIEDEHREEMEAALAKFTAQRDRVRGLNLKVGGLSALDNAVEE
jgi:hypothetical protein